MPADDINSKICDQRLLCHLPYSDNGSSIRTSIGVTGRVFHFLSSGQEFLASKGTGTAFKGVSLLPNFRFITGRFGFSEPFEALLSL
jgi:hypothetical protein|tara:strand:- start:250 stop:510 length:261 start_codon:yes stop_codon:yes gene_type:complete